MTASRPPVSDVPPSPTAARLPRTVWRRALLDYGPPLLLMALIYYASTDAGSAAHSGRFIGRALDWLGLGERLSPEELAGVHFVIRKAGHVTEYALLAVLLHRAVARAQDRWAPRRVIGVLAVAALYAASDEYHQSFVASRGASSWDVVLDTVGAALGLVAKWGVERWRGSRLTTDTTVSRELRAHEP